MISVSVLFVVAVVWPVLSLLALGLWIWVKYPAIEEGVSAEELDTLSDEPYYPTYMVGDMRNDAEYWRWQKANGVEHHIGVCTECDTAMPHAVEPGFCSYECYCRAMEVSAKEEN